MVRRREASGAAYRVGGLILIGTPVTGTEATGSTVVYARVSSADQRPGLDRQVARVAGWATGQHLPVDRVVTEVGSALNGHCRKFLALLRDPEVSMIVVEHRDRFAGSAPGMCRPRWRRPGAAC
jgi:predicted site-specific integrase-resolvase